MTLPCVFYYYTSIYPVGGRVIGPGGCSSGITHLLLSYSIPYNSARALHWHNMKRKVAKKLIPTVVPTHHFSFSSPNRTCLSPLPLCLPIAPSGKPPWSPPSPSRPYSVTPPRSPRPCPTMPSRSRKSLQQTPRGGTYGLRRDTCNRRQGSRKYMQGYVATEIAWWQ